MIKVKRAYESPDKQDGYRVLVDRIWPRGLTKQDAAIDRWLKDIAPSTELRKWFGHDPEKWQGFCKRYEAELAQKLDEVSFLSEKSRAGNLTLVLAAKDVEHNNALALKKYLESL